MPWHRPFSPKYFYTVGLLAAAGVAVLLLFLTWLSPIQASSSLQTSQVSLSVDASTEIYPFGDKMRGVATNNWNFLWHGLWDRGASEGCCPPGKKEAIIDATKQLRPGIIRFAGGLWANAVGWDRSGIAPDDGPWTYNDPDTGQTYSYNHAYSVGMIDSFADFATQLGSETIIQINVCDNNPKMWADLLRFTNIERGYNFKYWELGNEQTLDPCGLDPASYAERYEQYRAALKSVDPSIKMLGPVPHMVTYTGWEDTLFDRVGQDLDVLTWHWYQLTEWTSNSDSFAYEGGSLEALFAYDGNVGTTCHDGFGCTPSQTKGGNIAPDRLDRWTYRRGIAEAKMNYVDNNFRSIHPAMETAITEFGPHAVKHTHPINSNHTAALWLADMLPRWAYNGLDIVTYYSLEDGDNGPGSTNSRGLLGTWDSNFLDIRPIYYTEYLYSQYFGDMMVQSSTSDPEQKVVVWASKDSADPGSLKLMLVNLTGDTTDANLTITGFTPKLGEAYEMVSADPLSMADPGSFTEHQTTINGYTIPDYDISNPSVFQNALAAITPKQIAVSSNFNYSIPPYSAVALVLRDSGSPPPATVQPTPTPTPQPSAAEWPAKVDLTVGESYTYTLTDGTTRTLKLLSYNRIIPRHDISATIEVSGGGRTDTHTLKVAFTGVPVSINGLRVFAYAWKEADSYFEPGFEEVARTGGFPLTAGKDVGFALSDAKMTMYPGMDSYVYPWTIAFNEGNFIQTFLEPAGAGEYAESVWSHSGYDPGTTSEDTILMMTDGYVWNQSWGENDGGVWITMTNEEWFAPETWVWTHVVGGAFLPGISAGDFVTKGTPLALKGNHMGTMNSRDFGAWLFTAEIWNYQHKNDFPAPRYWLTLGPYSGGIGNVHINSNESGDLPDIQPKKGSADKDGANQWKFGDNFANSVVRLNELFSVAPFSGYYIDRLPKNSVGYASTYIYSPDSRTAHLKWGAIHDGDVWLNGKSVLSQRGGPLVVDQRSVSIPLQAGWNTLIIKTSVTTGPWLFSPKIGDANGNRIPELRFSTRDINLQTTSVGSTSIALNWSDPGFHGTHVETYKLDVARDAGFNNLVISDQDLGNVTTYTIAGLQQGTNYFVRVRPYNYAEMGGATYWQHVDAIQAKTGGIESVPVSKNPPGRLSASQAPQFVTFGSDDNNNENGVNWFVNELYAGQTNPSGTGNPATYDGTPVRGSFYLIGLHETYGSNLCASHRNAYLQGHEIGNHAYDDAGGLSEGQWLTSIGNTNTYLTRGPDCNATPKGVGVPASEIFGFRAPEDKYNLAMWTVIEDLGFTYAASTSTGYSPDTASGQHWPGTLDEPFPVPSSAPQTGSHPGFWEVPQSRMDLPPSLGGGQIGYCDLDWFWEWRNEPDGGAANIATMLKYNLDLHLNGNRAPMHLCLHSQRWDIKPWETDRSPNMLARQAALIDFMNYALSKNAVRVVRQIDVINWMRNPVALGTVPPGPTPTPTPTPTPQPTPTPTPGQGQGLSATYYDNIDFTGATVSRTDAEINFQWGSGSPVSGIGPDTFSVRWSGKVEPQFNETYTFAAKTDDGVRLWVDNKLVVNQWSDHGATEFSGTISLLAGNRYDIVMEYYENQGGALAELRWSGPSTPKQIIPQSQLFPGSPSSSPKLLSISVSPSTASVQVGQTAQFTATGNFDDSGTLNITSSATWVSSNLNVATVDAGGLATGVAAGTANIIASLGVVSSTASVSITVTEVTITGTLNVGSGTSVAGSTVEIPITLNTGGVPVRSVYLSLTYDAAALTSAVGAKGAALPDGWLNSSNSPIDGNMRFIALASDGIGRIMDGEIFTVTFTVPSDVLLGDVPVNVAVLDVREESNAPLAVSPIHGTITISDFLRGDADGDLQVTGADINEIIDWLIGRKLMPATGSQRFWSADVNGDNKIDLADLIVLVDWLLGRIVEFPAGS